MAAQRAASFLRQHAGLLLRLHAAPGNFGFIFIWIYFQRDLFGGMFTFAGTNKMESLRGLVAGLAPALHSSAGEQVGWGLRGGLGGLL